MPTRLAKLNAQLLAEQPRLSKRLQQPAIYPGPDPALLMVMWVNNPGKKTLWVSQHRDRRPWGMVLGVVAQTENRIQVHVFDIRCMVEYHCICSANRVQVN